MILTTGDLYILYIKIYVGMYVCVCVCVWYMNRSIAIKSKCKYAFNAVVVTAAAAVVVVVLVVIDPCCCLFVIVYTTDVNVFLYIICIKTAPNSSFFCWFLLFITSVLLCWLCFVVFCCTSLPRIRFHIYIHIHVSVSVGVAFACFSTIVFL